MSCKDREDEKKEVEKKDVENKEEVCGCFAVDSYKQACPPIRNVTHPLRYYEFTADEIKALEECDKESFYQRCLPFSTLFATATYVAVKRGWLRRNPHFGVIPKVLLAVVLGHIIGRLQYIPNCDRKLRHNLPANSHLGQVMRQYHKEKIPGCEKKP